MEPIQQQKTEQESKAEAEYKNQNSLQHAKKYRQALLKIVSALVYYSISIYRQNFITEQNRQSVEVAKGRKSRKISGESNPHQSKTYSHLSLILLIKKVKQEELKRIVSLLSIFSLEEYQRESLYSEYKKKRTYNSKYMIERVKNGDKNALVSLITNFNNVQRHKYNLEKHDTTSVVIEVNGVSLDFPIPLTLEIYLYLATLV